MVELEIDDLLGRDKVEPNEVLMQKNIKSKVVLVTGAGGSIGSELCRQISNIKPKKLLLDSNEFSLYSVLNEIETLQNDKDLEIIPILTSVQDKKKLVFC